MPDNSGMGTPTLGEMIAGHAAPSPPVVISPPAAPVIPATPAEAVARLNELKSNGEWRDRFLSGNGPEAKEFRDLQATIAKSDQPQVDRAMAGLLEDAPFQPSGHLQMIGTAEMLRDIGIRDEITRDVLAGT